MKTKLSKALSLILAVILAFGAMLPAFAADEIPEGYTPIYTAEDLNNIRNNLSGSYILMNDIDLSAYENWEPIGTNETPFTGKLDGNGYLIKYLNIAHKAVDGSTVYCGLFGKTSQASINKVSIYKADITANHSGEQEAKVFAGVVAGYAYRSEISYCAVSGKVRSEGFSTTNLGGIAGTGGTQTAINFCSNYVDIEATADSQTAYAYVGGITGTSTHTVIKCANFGAVSVIGESVKEDAEIKIGGIVGAHSEMWIGAVYNTGKISVGFSTPDTYIGGISGCTSMGLNLYNTGTVEMSENFNGYAGAISGNIETPEGAFGISYCVESSYYITTDLSAGYADGTHPDELSESEYGNYYNNVAELTDEEMKLQESFAGFDFDTVWIMEEGGCPVLQAQPTLTVKESLELEKGKTLSVESFDVWSSTEEAVAVVNENGEIAALSAGTATVTIELAYGYSIEYTVTVTDSTPEPTPTPDPEPKCPLLWLVKLIKKILNFVVGTVKAIIS